LTHALENIGTQLGYFSFFFLVVADFDWDEKKKKQSFIDMVVYNNIRVFSHRLGYKMAED
jgi:hypothetical protein